jgi:hypothetical protein
VSRATIKEKSIEDYILHKKFNRIQAAKGKKGKVS